MVFLKALKRQLLWLLLLLLLPGAAKSRSLCALSEDAGATPGPPLSWTPAGLMMD
jgi:hypothetical protein